MHTKVAPNERSSTMQRQSTECLPLFFPGVTGMLFLPRNLLPRQPYFFPSSLCVRPSRVHLYALRTRLVIHARTATQKCQVRSRDDSREVPRTVQRGVQGDGEWARKRGGNAGLRRHLGGRCGRATVSLCALRHGARIRFCFFGEMCDST